MSAPACDWFVVTIDPAGITRPVFGPSTEDACENAAETYWETACCAGEEVHICCEHNDLMEYVEAPN